MNNLLVGYSHLDITPPMGIPIYGYFKPRYAEGILDNLEVVVTAISNNDKIALIIALDLCSNFMNVAENLIDFISKKYNVSKDSIFLHCTHTHTGPFLETPEVIYNEKSRYAQESEEVKILLRDYFYFVRNRISDAIAFAIKDLKKAKMGVGISKAENIGFIRRFKMKDGSVQTNPGVNNPDIVEPIGDIDERVNVVRFDREGAETILLVNYGNHPDTIGGNLISGDWPSLFRRKIEKTLDNVKSIFLNGAQGDINHVNVHPTKGDFNDMFNDFDGVSRGYGHARHMANVVTGAVLQVYDKVEYQDNLELKVASKIVKIPSNMPKKEEIPQAKYIAEMHNAGKDAELPYKGMLLTTVVAEALRMLDLENGPEFFKLNLVSISIGDVVLVGIPGEPFNAIGLALKSSKEWRYVLPCCLTNGCLGYYPVKDAYDEGGYEARSSKFKSGVAELISNEGLKLLHEIKIK